MLFPSDSKSILNKACFIWGYKPTCSPNRVLIISLILCLFIYSVLIFYMKYFKHQKIVNLIFFLIIYLCYWAVVIVAYIRNGLYDWNFTNTLPTANVSPFMFGTLPLFYILPKKVKPYYLNLISLLSLGMLFSPILSMVFNFSRQYSFHVSFLLDYIAHFAISLWGIYFVKSKQITLKIRSSAISGSLIIGVAIIMMVLSVILDKSFFGLSLNGKHSIYNFRVTESSFLNAALYFIGLILVLFAGYSYQLMLQRIYKHI